MKRISTLLLAVVMTVAMSISVFAAAPSPTLANISDGNATISYVGGTTYNGNNKISVTKVTSQDGNGKSQTVPSSGYTVYIDGKKTTSVTTAGTHTVEIRGTGQYNGTITKTITIKKAASKATVSATKTVNKASSSTQTSTVKVSNTNGQKVTYTSSNTKIATVDKNGKVTFKANVSGTVKITATVAASTNYNGKTLTKTFTLAKQSSTARVTQSVKSFKKTSSAKTVTISTSNTHGAKVTYSMSSKYASVNSTTGKVTFKRYAVRGTYKVTVKVAATGAYNATTKTVTIRIY
jgi:hypothetical protein